jgi:RNA polymerase sigma factor (sigma-70 family)
MDDARAHARGDDSASRPRSDNPASDNPASEPRAALIDLARRAGSGDTHATGQLLKALAPKITDVVRAVLGPTHPDLDDAVQHALLGLVQALPAFRGECDPLGYGRVIAVRSALAIRKRARAMNLRRDEEAEPESIPSPRSPGDELGARERTRILRELLALLPPEQAEALALRIVLGLSLDEVARETGVPLNTVRSRVRLAKERLRARIERDERLREVLEVRR